MCQRKLVLYIAASLDGYIAGDGESLDWLDTVEGEGDNGYSVFYDTVDTLLMGRKTYDWILANTVSFPYEGKECYVFSREERENQTQVKFVREDVTQFVNMLKDCEGKRIWLVGGGDLLRTFLKENLVDEMILTVVPVVLGSGVPLFSGKEAIKSLHLKNTVKFGQFIQLHYICEMDGPKH